MRETMLEILEEPIRALRALDAHILSASVSAVSGDLRGRIHVSMPGLRAYAVEHGGTVESDGLTVEGDYLLLRVQAGPVAVVAVATLDEAT